jgi:hypothetical protein
VSLLALTSRPPRSTNATSVTASRCPFSRYSPASAATSHTITSVSRPPLASRPPERLKRRQDTPDCAGRKEEGREGRV